MLHLTVGTAEGVLFIFGIKVARFLDALEREGFLALHHGRDSSQFLLLSWQTTQIRRDFQQNLTTSTQVFLLQIRRL